MFIFYLNYPSPPGVFLYLSSGIPHPALFCVNFPYPQIRFCLTPPPPLDFFYDYIYTRIFSSLPMSAIPSCILYQLIPPPVLSSLPLSGIPSYSFAPATPHPFIFATFRTPDFSQPPLQFSLLYPRKLVSCVVHRLCF